MRTKREQVQAYRFVIRRIVSAMVQGNPESLEFPMRRTVGSTIGGIAIALLVFVGFWVVGAIFGGGHWRDQPEGTIVVNEETGAVYLYLTKVLYPVENLTSARLLLTDAEPRVEQVSTADLAGMPLGDRFGIHGAPETLVDPSELVDLPWQVCSAPNRSNNTNRDSFVTLSAPSASDVLGDEALLVKAAEDTFLIWNNLKFPVPEATALTSLGLSVGEAPIPVHKVFTDGLHTGPELVPPTIPGAGDSAEEIDDAVYGDFFTSGDIVYILTSKGLARVSEVSQRLLTEGQLPSPEPLSSSEIARIGTVEVENPQIPETVPSSADITGQDVICAVYNSDSDDIVVATYSSSDPPAAITAPTNVQPIGQDDEVDTADHVWVPPGSGALVRARANSAAADGTVYLITDSGFKYALEAEAQKLLGYESVTPTPVPTQLVALVPNGPVLSPDEVRAQYDKIRA